MKAAVRDFVVHGGDFDALALALFAWQRARNPAYARIAGDVVPRRVEDIPAVPVALFKELPLTCFPVEEARVTFLTSGTTSGRRGAHRLRDTDLYDLAAPLHFHACVPRAPTRVHSLVSHDPDSSLGHMVALFGEPGPLVGPVFLAATAFALDAAFEADLRADLDDDSVVMVTGGFKGRRVRLDSDALYREIRGRLGTPRVVGEYGMTELSSQLWTDPVPAGEVPGPFLAPPWLAVYTVDPSSGEPCDREGLLRFVDLCNVESVLAIETMDLGRVDGPWVTLKGRLEGAEARGCSMRHEDLLASVRTSRSQPRG